MQRPSRHAPASERERACFTLHPNSAGYSRSPLANQTVIELFKFLGKTAGVIFLIGLVVVIGLLMLIF